MRLGEGDVSDRHRLDPRAHLYRILQAADVVNTAVFETDWEDYEQDVMLRSAVERQFITIGGALSELLRLEPDLERWVSRARDLIALRETLIGRYWEPQHRAVWASVHEDLPVLRREVEELLAEMGAAG